MPAERTITGLRTLWAGGTDREGAGQGPLVALLHGYGANAADLFGLWRLLEVPRGVRFAFPEAPLPLEASGFPSFAWWSIDFDRLEAAETGRISLDVLVDDVPAGMDDARRRIADWLDALQGETPDAPIVLGGFSQGAMLALETALHRARGIAALVLLSGSYVNGATWRTLAPRLSPTPFFQSHGRNDPLLPFELAQALHQMLRAAGHPGTFRPFSGGHEIAPEVLVDLSSFLRELPALAEPAG